ncbi:hypothetical protein KGF54_002815 [Candida jiufengensis]|uniref:uncharacterized protein n=1 Tax=Candida jiufengensis TaxID=497108 RepID=UPI0022254B2D|nr:uncharacterized protein KGF54_002815 [Candida jiufengensis]KAI5953443.1 hypothetical protein KGF54_002815 [Candida jiufengensis]
MNSTTLRTAVSMSFMNDHLKKIASSSSNSANTTSSSIHSTTSSLRKKKSTSSLTPPNSSSNHNILKNKSSIADLLQGNANHKTTPESPSYYQETIFKLFTYIVILLPTLTSILFPINSNTIPKNEQIGNFIIDLLTVILISWVVRFTMEWPYNWMKKLQQTKARLFKELNSNNNLNNENTDKIIMLIRKIYTFEIIALICCLISSILSSTLLIWTRKYTIIDQKRKKMVFNNVNIALLQFWSIFRIMITFIESLQNSSLNNNNIYVQNSNFQNWLQDLKHYFLPNLTNQILLDHLQINNKQLDKLKLDLLKVKKELKSREEYDEVQQRQLIQSHQQQIQENIQLQQLLQQQQQQSQSQQHLKSGLPQHQIHYETIDSNQSISPFPLSLSPKEGSPPNSPTLEYPNQQPLQLQQPLLPRRKSFHGKTPLKTIVEQEEDLVFESLETPSFTKFDNTSNSILTDPTTTTTTVFNKNYHNNNSSPIHSLSNIEFLQIVKKTIRNLQNELSIFDFVTHPNFVRKVLFNEFNSIFVQVQFHDYEILRFFILEIYEIYILGVYVSVMDNLLDIFQNPFQFIFKIIWWGCFKIPIYAITFYFKILFHIPILIMRLILIKPLGIIYFIAQTVLSVILRSTTSLMITDKFKSSSTKFNSYNNYLQQHQQHQQHQQQQQQDQKKSQKIHPLVTDHFTMKQFHLSPTLKDEEDYFVNNNHNNTTFNVANLNNSTDKKLKFKNNPLISVTPHSINNVSGGGNGGYKFDTHHVIYED